MITKDRNERARMTMTDENELGEAERGKMQYAEDEIKETSESSRTAILKPVEMKGEGESAWADDIVEKNEYAPKDERNMTKKHQKRWISRSFDTRMTHGICFNCRLPGHFARDCKQERVREKKTKKWRREFRECHSCGKVGHLEAVCRSKRT